MQVLNHCRTKGLKGITFIINFYIFANVYIKVLLHSKLFYPEGAVLGIAWKHIE